MESKTKELKALQIMYFALLAGQIGLGFVACFVVNRGFSDARFRSITYILLTIAALLSIGALVAGYILFNKRLERLRALTDLSTKMQYYRAACTLKWALFEGPCLYVMVCYLLTGQAAFLGVAGLLILNFLSNYPSKKKVVQELDLTSQEEALFE